ncbi:unnamed protein product [Rotaria sp. Silwood2]|nr:unnamed protein product [Rotaria sp. Silwood2]CAF2871769.1 unnamed protein product [Rotaria sp. Silwood2]CAF2976996.1 unnamed protein product [Rotaria sp. Silwood2]CAF3987713.1 unnamed protein product [Rotaria sp. Silwood2]CAF4149586.1 unnamed protein product [Rotaria sp. Silwood2]
MHDAGSNGNVRNALIQSTDISLAFDKTLHFIRTECKVMLYVVEHINRECGSHFDFVVNSIFPELIQCLEQSFNILFFHTMRSESFLGNSIKC